MKVFVLVARPLVKDGSLEIVGIFLSRRLAETECNRLEEPPEEVRKRLAELEARGITPKTSDLPLIDYEIDDWEVHES